MSKVNLKKINAEDYDEEIFEKFTNLKKTKMRKEDNKFVHVNDRQKEERRKKKGIKNGN